jgi:putative flippase GtrA
VITESSIATVPVAAPGMGRLSGQLTRFAAIGGASTIGYLSLYLLLRGPLGAFAANPVALLITAIVNTTANRRVTFGVTGHHGRFRQHAAGLAIFALGVALTSGALAGLAAVSPQAPKLVEIGVLIFANFIATVLRFVVLRAWVFASTGKGLG